MCVVVYVLLTVPALGGHWSRSRSHTVNLYNRERWEGCSGGGGGGWPPHSLPPRQFLCSSLFFSYPKKKFPPPSYSFFFSLFSLILLAFVSFLFILSVFLFSLAPHFFFLLLFKPFGPFSFLFTADSRPNPFRRFPSCRRLNA